MSSRGPPASSPPVQIAQQQRHNAAATRGQTPPTGYRQPEEYQPSGYQQPPLYPTPPLTGVAPPHYDGNKGFVVPSTQNQGGASPHPNMYPANTGMSRNNQPQPFYQNRPTGRMQPNYAPTQQSQPNYGPQMSFVYAPPPAPGQYQSSQIFMLPAANRPYNAPPTQPIYMPPSTMPYTPRYGNPATYFNNPQQPMQTNVPPAKHKRNVIKIVNPDTNQDITNEVLHLNDQSPGSNDSRSSNTPNSVTHENESDQKDEVKAEFFLKVAESLYTDKQKKSPSPSQEQQQSYPGQAPAASTPNQTGVPHQQHQGPSQPQQHQPSPQQQLHPQPTAAQQQPHHQPPPPPQQQQQQQQQPAGPTQPQQPPQPPLPQQQAQQPKSSQVNANVPSVVPNDTESAPKTTPPSQSKAHSTSPTDLPPPKAVANNVDPVIQTKQEDSSRVQSSNGAASSSKVGSASPAVLPGKTFASQVKQQPPSEASRSVSDKSKPVPAPVTIPATAATPSTVAAKETSNSPSPSQPPAVGTDSVGGKSSDASISNVTAPKPNVPAGGVSMASIVAGKKPSDTGAKSETPPATVEAAPAREKTPEVNIVPPSPSEKVKVKEPAQPPPSSMPAVTVQEVSVKEPPKKEKQSRKALNQKGDSKLGSDMDAFMDSLPEECKPDRAPSSGPSAAEKENTDPKPTKAASLEREVSPGPQKEKEMSPAEEKVQKAEVKVQQTPPAENRDNAKYEEDEEEDQETEDAGDAANDLKYKYSEDQWSPLNPEGKKHYDREFLLQFQFASEAVIKPRGLPEIPDIILPSPAFGSGSYRREFSDGGRGSSSRGGNEGYDFTPNYVWSQGQGGGRGGQNQVPKRMSGQKNIRNDKGQGGPLRQISISLSKDVELHHAEKAWKPSHRDVTTAEEDAATQDLYKKARSILNKLTPQKFSTLVNQMQALAIDTESKLKGVIDLVFEKAISEPNFSVAYANMCRCLSMFKVPSESKPGDMVNFRAVLLTRCQREFEKDKSSEQLFITKRKELADETDTTKKEELKAELEYEESKAKRRSLGNIRFIGELFKLKMLTESIMHDCVFKLLRTKDPENLECLCRLLTTIGKELDTDKAKPRMEQYFQQMGKIVNEKKTSARVRFMLQDVMDLRKNKWVPRRDDNNPKTIDQIHKEVAKEAQDRAINSQNILIQQKASKGSAQGDRGRRGPQGGPMGMQGGEGWNTVANRTPLRSVDRTIDPSKMKISKPAQVDDSIQLGPGGGAGRFAGWGRGSTGGGARASQESERPSNPNRFSALGGKQEEEGGRRGFGGASPARDGRGRGGFGRPTMLSARHSQEAEREKAIAAAKSIGVSQSVDGGRRERSRGRELEKERPAPQPAEPEIPSLSSEEMSKKTTAILDEFLHIQDMKEALLCVKELPPSNHADFVTNALNHVLERSDVARKQTGNLLHDLVKKSLVSVNSYIKGLKDVLEFADDMAIDIPKIWQYLGELISPMIQDGSVPLSFLKEACEPLRESNKAGVLVSEILHDASHREGHKKVAELWASSGLQWTDFVAKNQVEDFLKEKKLEFTKGGDSAPTTPTTGLPLDKIASKLQTLVNQRANNEEIFDWIESNVDEPTTKQKKFIRALMTAVCSSAITGEGSNAKVDPEVIKNRNDLLQKYLDHQAEWELQALYALQALVTKLEHPPGVLRQMFDTLYDEDIISEDAFMQWEKSDDPQEQEGKGVAMKQVVQFFTWLAEADEDGDS